MYNLTNVTATNSIQEFFVEVNLLTSGYTSVLLLTAIFVVMFITLKNYQTESAMLVSSFITSIVAVLLFAMGVLSTTYMTIPFMLLFGTVFMKVFGSSDTI